jgi:ribosome-associated protein
MMIAVGQLDHELTFDFTRSSGPGGQHVNKVNTKVILKFNIDKSSVLKEKEKNTIKLKLSSRLNSLGELVIISQEKRSQYQNKQTAIIRFYELINKALKLRKKRLRTLATLVSKEKRIKEKKELSEKKQRRRLDSSI